MVHDDAVSMQQQVFREKLAEIMSDISEETWCAGWLIDLEYYLWQDIQRGTTEGYTEREFSGKQLAQMLFLSEKIGGWIVWNDDTAAAYIPMAAWLPLYSDWKEKRA